MTATITQEINIDWSFFVVQALNIVVVFGLFALAARAILLRGKGWEVPLWLILSFFIPVVFPILAMITFRKSKHEATGEQAS